MGRCRYLEEYSETMMANCIFCFGVERGDQISVLVLLTFIEAKNETSKWPTPCASDSTSTLSSTGEWWGTWFSRLESISLTCSFSAEYRIFVLKSIWPKTWSHAQNFENIEMKLLRKTTDDKTEYRTANVKIYKLLTDASNNGFNLHVSCKFTHLFRIYLNCALIK